MGAAERRKGIRAEQEVCLVLRHFGFAATRISPLEAAAGEVGDVSAEGLRWQVKRRRHSPLYAMLGSADVLAVRGDGQQWLAVLPLARLAELLSTPERRVT